VQTETETPLDKCPGLDAQEAPEVECCDEQVVEVLSSCSSKFDNKQSAKNDEAEDPKQFNAFANSFHLNDKVRASMSLPRLTEDMLKINEELQAISSQTITDEVQEPKLVAKTPAPAKEKAPATTAETQVETVKSTPA